MKKYFALIIASLMMLTLPNKALAAEVNTPVVISEVCDTTVNDEIVTASSTYRLATYYDYDFYMASMAKQIYLETYCVQMTYRCVCADNSYDAMTIIITDLNGGGYSKYIDMAADGQSHTISLYLPAGYYKIQLDGSIKLHSHAAINFYGYA